jgi:transcriptional regulator with XRE-family HTH domain
MARRSFGSRLGARLRAQREALGYTQAKLAEKAGVTPNYIGVLEHGAKLPSIDTLVKLAKALEMSPAQLFGDMMPEDQWLDDVKAVASTVPESRREMALAVLKTIATHKGPDV